MKLNEFDFQVKRLEAVYGANKYPEARKEVLWEKFQHLDAKDFKQGVGNLIASEPFAPMLTKFEEAMFEPLRIARAKYRERTIQDLPDCNRCQNEGVAIFYKKAAGWSYAFQCTCKRGELLYPAFPRTWGGMGKIYAGQRELVTGKYEKPKPENMGSGPVKKIEGFKTLSFKI